MFYKDLLLCFVQMSKEVLGDNLVGIYLHGSAVMGCFNSKKSDLDLIIVVENDISQNTKLDFLSNVVKLNEKAPEKGLELSIVKREFCNPFMYPTPFEFHFSITHLVAAKENPATYIENMQGTDKDLAAHFVIIKHCGKVLCGEDMDDVFGEVSKAAYVDSIWNDINEACEDILKAPMYITLNLCRALAYLQEDLILSKKAGGEWGIQVLPQKFWELIQNALWSYETDAEMIIDSEIAVDFAKYMLSEISLAIPLKKRYTN